MISRMNTAVVLSLLLLPAIFADEPTTPGGGTSTCSRQLNNSQNITVVAAPGAKGEPGTEGPQGQKGEPGVKALRGAPGKLGPVGPAGEKGDKGEQGLAGEKGAPGTSPPTPPFVAFSVARTTKLEKPSSNTVVTYDVILSNVGGAYNQETGKFVATVGGVYFFTFTGMTLYLPNAIYFVCLMKNGAKMVSLLEINDQQSNGQSSSNSAILQLQPGDEVWVELGSDRSLYSDSGKYLTFSGFLIHAI
uniref:C1q domain-containing protein n=1 Tax=Branchiostoma floridae TaxID=7739 RepID=C3Z6P1_BRAFL|eukprot:XP_002595475.1 hypothetical protein BRAFLDRAFT_69139 [Branchiostoma floridae]